MGLGVRRGDSLVLDVYLVAMVVGMVVKVAVVSMVHVPGVGVSPAPGPGHRVVTAVLSMVILTLALAMAVMFVASIARVLAPAVVAHLGQTFTPRAVLHVPVVVRMVAIRRVLRRVISVAVGGVSLGQLNVAQGLVVGIFVQYGRDPGVDKALRRSRGYRSLPTVGHLRVLRGIG